LTLINITLRHVAYTFAAMASVLSGATAREWWAMISRRTLLGLGLAGGALAAGGVTMSAYAAAMNEAQARIDPAQSRVIASRFGDVEYADVGAGAPVMMIHGTGGGFDQGLAFAKPLRDAGYRIIAPSRFGYLRSAFPDDPSPENQADALVDVMDALGVESAAIAGGSAGALSAIAFAIRHPDRTTALVALVPATYTPDRPPARPWSASQQSLAEAVLRSDFLFWAALKAAPGLMTRTLLATDPELVAAADPTERARVADILAGILPVSARAAGLLNDARQAGDPPSMALETIRAPTLAISLEDDRFLTADAARHIAATVPGAKLIVHPTGGHVWVGRNEQIFGEIDSFLNGIGQS
jgi:pimeloyl-ACP methyl ester carboxylesterase